MLARAPLNIRSQVSRLRVASPARYAHGHGEYHVRFSCSFQRLLAHRLTLDF